MNWRIKGTSSFILLNLNVRHVKHSYGLVKGWSVYYTFCAKLIQIIKERWRGKNWDSKNARSTKFCCVSVGSDGILVGSIVRFDNYHKITVRDAKILAYMKNMGKYQKAYIIHHIFYLVI